MPRAGLTSQSRGDGSSKKSSGDAGLTSQSRKATDKFVDDSRKQARRDFTDAIQDHGGETDEYRDATEITKHKMFRHGVPDGDRAKWKTEDKARIAVGEKRVADAIRNDGGYGRDAIIDSTQREAREANGDCNDSGVMAVFRWVFGYGDSEPGHAPDDCHSNDGFGSSSSGSSVKERRQTDADDEDDSHLTEGGRLLRKQRKAQAEAEAEESSGGGLLQAIFGNGKTVWDEEQYYSSSASVEPDEVEEESSGGGFWNWFFNP
jgi:hypothetical protein